MLSSKKNKTTTTSEYIKKIRDEVDKLETGDIICFIGKNIFSWLIMGLQKIFLNEKFKKNETYKFSHLGIVLKDDDDNGILKILESPKVPFTKIDGVELFDLKDRMMNYNGKFVLYKLNKPLSIDQKNQVKRFYDEHKDKKYERSVVELVKSVIDDSPIISENEKDLSTIFCSELTAEIFIKMGLLPPNDVKPSNEYTPSEFINSDLLNGYKFVKGITFKGGINL